MKGSKPVVFSNTSLPSENQRQKLLAQIRGGVRLRHVQTQDKSGPVLQDECQPQMQQEAPQHFMRPATPNGSLDSQGKSPSPSLAACSSASGDSCSSWLSPSPPAGIPLWLSSPSSDFSSPVEQQQCSPASNSPSQLSLAGSQSLATPASNGGHSLTKHWPEVQPAMRVVMGGAGGRRKSNDGGKQADYRFDEEKQVKDRQQEVSTLVGSGGAQSRIAAFRQLQSRIHQQEQPKESSASARSFCTLPRTGGIQRNKPTATFEQKPSTAKMAPMNGRSSNGGLNGTAMQGQNRQLPTVQPKASLPKSSMQPQLQPPRPSPTKPEQRKVPSSPPTPTQSNHVIATNNVPKTWTTAPATTTISISPPQPAQQQPEQQSQNNNNDNNNNIILHRSFSSSSQIGSIASTCATPPPTPQAMFQNSQPVVPAPFYRPYTPRMGQRIENGGADSHRQNFERIRNRFGAIKQSKSEEEGPTMNGRGGSAETGEEEHGAEAVWKSAARQRKQLQKESPVPPPLPDCPPPSLDFNNGIPQQQFPDWSTLRENFKFAVDLDGGPDGKALVRIVRR